MSIKAINSRRNYLSEEECTYRVHEKASNILGCPKGFFCFIFVYIDYLKITPNARFVLILSSSNNTMAFSFITILNIWFNSKYNRNRVYVCLILMDFKIKSTYLLMWNFLHDVSTRSLVHLIVRIKGFRGKG
jgi:hypothetical protein